jgi:hypothetical protein
MRRALEMEHMQAVSDANASEPFDWIDERDRIVGPTLELERACLHRQTRSINWRQSFARRELPFEHYYMVEPRDGGYSMNGKYVFKRHAQADKSLPSRVVFEWDTPDLEEDEVQPALQGDVITYPHTQLYLRAKRLSFVRAELTEASYAKYRAMGTVFTCSRLLQGLVERLRDPERREYIRCVLDIWDPKTSFLCVSY